MALESLADEMHLRRLLSPAESVNSITVGAAHDDGSSVPAGTHRDLIEGRRLASPVSALGLGFRRSIKPEVLVGGGRQLYRDTGGDGGTTTVSTVRSARPPGNLAAAPGHPGELSGLRHSRGTSNAAARASHGAHQIFEDVVSALEPIGAGASQLQREHEIALLKALVVHSAEWGDAARRLEGVLRSRSGPYLLRDFIGRFLGYGSVDFNRVRGCADQRATMIGYGRLEAEDAHEYTVPLPASLSGEAVWRRLAVTLAWMTPINTRHRAYRRAQLWFSPPQEELAVSRVGAQWQAVQRGTVQHEVLEGDRAAVFATGTDLTFMVSCRADAGALEEGIPYGVAVTLEVAEQTSLPMDQQISERLRPVVRIAPGA